MSPDSDQAPSVEEVIALAHEDGIALSARDAEQLLPIIERLTLITDLLDRVDAEPALDVAEGRDPGYTPSPAEDEYNAFIRRCNVVGAKEGTLAGLSVGVKDNIAVAGVPMTNASRLSSYTPAHDAVVVERILAAGGTIAGKLNMDDFGASGLGETSAFGVIRNPVDPSRTAGGSSGGSGAAVRARYVDLALGVDQGGSGRIPAAFCGVVAAKATHGLVPSWGSSHVDHTIDAITPLGRTVGAIATLLEVIAGSDDRDAQWVREEPSAGRYSRAGEKPMEGLRIAVVSESVDAEACEPAVLENFWRAVDSLREDGAVVSEQSIPLWIDGAAIFFPYMAHLYSATFRSDGQPGGHLGAYDVHALSAFAQSRQAESSLLADQVKCWLISDRFVQGRFGGLAFARLHNARLALRRMISTTLESFDLLLTPTVNMVAPPLFPPDVPYAEKAILAGSYCFNTAPLNLSGHPALSVPTGTDAGGLPTAIQIIARHFEDELAFSAAFALERQLGPFCP